MNILKIDLKKPDVNAIKRAVDVFDKGGLVVYPTDTAYGLGVNAFDKNNYRIFLNVKLRLKNKPTHVIVKNWKTIESICVVNSMAKKLYDKYLPGPITLILKKKKIVPNLLTGGLPTVGVRIPNCEVTKAISNLLKFPYTTASANRQGEATPYSLEELKKVLDLAKVDLVLDAGNLPHTPPSTMVDISGDEVKILREGPVSSKEIFDIVG